MLKEDRDFVLSLGAIFIEEEIFYIKNFLSDDLLSKIQKEIEHHNKLESSGEKYTCYVEDNGNISTMQYEPWHYYEHGHSFDNIFPLTDLNIKKELHDKTTDITILRMEIKDLEADIKDIEEEFKIKTVESASLPNCDCKSCN